MNTLINKDNLLNQYKESKRLLKQAMDNHQLVLFVGAGPSIASGMPSWKQAIKSIAEKLAIEEIELDYLRIPQYFFNSRGKKEYTQLIHTVFRYGEHLQKHEIHDKIIDFNTDTIITTNYDHLIEQAAEDNSQILSVVSKDADLPYRKGGKELIKMHGDFENDNFVLKEDDYLYYSKNFKLIENYVKSLIGTKVVLFVGYSFNDPDLKLIFSWVKNILGGDFQRAYLIQVDSSYDINEAEYFKNFGINLLYASIQLQGKYSENDFTNNLLQMLEWLQKEDETDILTSLHNSLKPLLSMNYASQNYVKTPLLQIGIWCNSNSIGLRNTHFSSENENETVVIFKALVYEQWVRLGKHIIVPNELIPFSIESHDKENEIIVKNFQAKNNQLVAEYLEGYVPNDKIQSKINDILDVLCKSNLMFIECYLQKNSKECHKAIIPLNPPPPPQWIEYVNTFNYNEIQKVIEHNYNYLSETRPDLYMEQGYLQFILGNYLASYTSYKNAKTIYYKHRDYVKYFIAEFNRFSVGKTISNNPLPNSSKNEISEIEKECKTIDMDKLFNSIPDLGESNKALKDIYTFNVAYTIFQDAYKSHEKVLEEAQTQYFFFAGTAAFAEMMDSVKDYYSYISRNLLPVNNYTEHMNIFRIYFQSIVSSAMASNNHNTIENTINFGNIHASELQPFDLMVALKFLNSTDLAKITKRLSATLPLNDNAIEYLQTVIENSNKAMKFPLISDSIWIKCLTILCCSNLSETLTEKSLKKINELSNKNYHRFYGNQIASFIDNAYKQNVLTNSAIKHLETFLIHTLKSLLSEGSNGLYIKEMLTLILFVLKDYKCIFDKPKYIRPLLNGELKLLCAYLYPYLGKQCQNLIKSTFYNWKFAFKSHEFEFYYALAYNEIIKPNAEAEKHIFEYYTIPPTDCDNTQALKTIPVRNKDNFLYNLLNLYIKNLIIDKETCYKLIISKNVPGAEWLMNYQKYNYSNFDINWLTICSQNLLVEICKNKNIRLKIKQIFENKYSINKPNQKLIDIYFKYLV